MARHKLTKQERCKGIRKLLESKKEGARGLQNYYLNTKKGQRQMREVCGSKSPVKKRRKRRKR